MRKLTPPPRVISYLRTFSIASSTLWKKNTWLRKNYRYPVYLMLRLSQFDQLQLFLTVLLTDVRDLSVEHLVSLIRQRLPHTSQYLRLIRRRRHILVPLQTFFQPHFSHRQQLHTVQEAQVRRKGVLVNYKQVQLVSLFFEVLDPQHHNAVLRLDRPLNSLFFTRVEAQHP